MKLTQVHVTEYKSIRDSTPFATTDITCLVGKNESGKTALLEALYRLNPIVPEQGRFDVTDHYPRADVEDYQQAIEAEEREHASVVEATFQLEDSDLTTLTHELGTNCLADPSVTLTKGYDNELTFSLDIDEPAIVKTLVAAAELPTDVTGEANQKTSIDDLLAYLNERSAQQQRAVAEAQAKADAIEDAAAQAKAKERAAKLAESLSAKTLRARVAKLAEHDLDTYIWQTHLSKHLPKFLYFDEYYLMDGHLNIEALKQRQASNTLTNSDRPMLGLLELARLDLDQLVNPARTEELISKLEGASNHLSKQVLKYWSQNKHLDVTFDVRPARPEDPLGMKSGTNLWGRVRDTVHRVSTLLGTRSKGFVWFFSFLAWFSQQKKKNEPLILLLDEPGLFLHGKAQGDLLRYIEAELKPHHQVIYTTHSPFMVDAEHFERVRIVQDKSMDAGGDLPLDQQGTKVHSEVLEATEDSLFPLQGALGYDIAQTLFIGPNNLIVEGVSDLIYIQIISALLQKQGKNGLDTRWTITPVGGSDKVPTFVALLGAQKKLNIATLIDLQSKDQQRIENLYKQKLLKKSHVLTFASFTGQTEADIEDMFEPKVYLGLVNGEYDLTPPLTVSSLPKGKRRILVRVEEYLQANPSAKGEFNHYRPARYLAENVDTLGAKISDATLDRFQKAFDAVNALLRK